MVGYRLLERGVLQLLDQQRHPKRRDRVVLHSGRTLSGRQEVQVTLPLDNRLLEVLRQRPGHLDNRDSARLVRLVRDQPRLGNLLLVVPRQHSHQARLVSRLRRQRPVHLEPHRLARPLARRPLEEDLVLLHLGRLQNLPLGVRLVNRLLELPLGPGLPLRQPQERLGRLPLELPLVVVVQVEVEVGQAGHSD